MRDAAGVFKRWDEQRREGPSAAIIDESNRLLARAEAILQDFREANTSIYDSNGLQNRIQMATDEIRSRLGTNAKKVERKTKDLSNIVLYDQFMKGVDNVS